MKRNVWLLRPMPHGTNHMQDFLEDGFIAIGYPVGHELSQYDYSQIRYILQQHGWDEGIGNVNILVHEMSIGDIVVVPDSNKKDVYFCEVTSEYVYDPAVDHNKAGSGYPHQRKVKWFFEKKPLLRSDLPEALLGSLRYPGTVADITKHHQLIDEILNFGYSIDPETENLRESALGVLKELLNSENEEVRLRAAEAILRS